MSDFGGTLLARRNVENPQELAYYVVFCPRAQAPLSTLARVVGSRWHVEECFETAKGEYGLDQYEVRKWDAWHRHVTLSLLVHAFLPVTRSTVTEGVTGGFAQPPQKGVSAQRVWLG